MSNALYPDFPESPQKQNGELIALSTEAEVEACPLVGEMELIDGRWVTLLMRPGRLYRRPLLPPL